MMKLLPLLLVFSSLAGCKTFVNSLANSLEDDILPPGWLESVEALATDERPISPGSGSAQIVFKRAWSMVGAAVPHCVIDTGTGTKKDAYLFQHQLVAETLSDYDIRWNMMAIVCDNNGLMCGVPGAPYLAELGADGYVSNLVFKSKGWVFNEPNLLWTRRRRRTGENELVPLSTPYPLPVPGPDYLMCETIFQRIAGWTGKDYSIPEFTASLREDLDAEILEVTYVLAEDDVGAQKWVGDSRWTLAGVTEWGPMVTIEATCYDGIILRDRNFAVDTTLANEVAKVRFRVSQEDVYEEVAKRYKAHCRRVRFINQVRNDSTICWKREPGTMRLEVFTPAGDHSFMAPVEIEAGYTYTVEYSSPTSGSRFEVSKTRTDEGGA